MRRIQKWGIALAAITAGTQLNTTEACTRVVYQGKDNLFPDSYLYIYIQCYFMFLLWAVL